MNDLLSPEYKYSFVGAILFHFLILCALLIETHSNQPVLQRTADQSMSTPISDPGQEISQAISAVSVDQREVMDAVNQLKHERDMQQRAEMNRQQALQKQAEIARQQRLNEQQQLMQLKRESAQLAAQRAKQLQEEQQHLNELARLKQQEEKKLEAMKQQALVMEKKQQAAQKALALKQTQEAKKLTELKKQQAVSVAHAEHAKADLAKADLAKAELAKAEQVKAALAKKQQAAQVAARQQAEAAQMAGEVDKYKAMILGAISQQWILPENANPALSSQFRIHLAPNGTVLSVNLVRSSGDPVLDRSAQSAIYKASPLPVPMNATAFNVFRDINLTVRPQNARG